MKGSTTTMFHRHVGVEAIPSAVHSPTTKLRQLRSGHRRWPISQTTGGICRVWGCSNLQIPKQHSQWKWCKMGMDFHSQNLETQWEWEWEWVPTSTKHSPVIICSPEPKKSQEIMTCSSSLSYVRHKGDFQFSFSLFWGFFKLPKTLKSKIEEKTDTKRHQIRFI